MYIVWAGFVAMILTFIALDLGLFHRESKAISIAEALAWTGIWIGLSLLFNGFVYHLYANDWYGLVDDYGATLTGRQAAIQFLTGYLLEKSLSVDNIFVISMIFAYFKVPLAEQHRVLFWGIVGAIVMRALMIGAGAVLIERFDWMAYLFGALLLMSAARMLVIRHDNIDTEGNAAIRLVKRIVPVTAEFHGRHFFITTNGVRTATPLFLALVMVETSDVLFAVDSIPAIFAVTRDPFLVFTSNVFAILGLRSLYFAIAGMMERFRFLKSSLVFILGYVGTKMLLTHHYPIPNVVSLAVIGGILAVGILASICAGERDTARLESPLGDYLEDLAIATAHQARRVVILVFGSTLLILGAALLVLPGPGIPFVLLGVLILSAEAAWARRLFRRVRRMMRNLQQRHPRTSSTQDKSLDEQQ